MRLTGLGGAEAGIIASSTKFQGEKTKKARSQSALLMASVAQNPVDNKKHQLHDIHIGRKNTFKRISFLRNSRGKIPVDVDKRDTKIDQSDHKRVKDERDTSIEVIELIGACPRQYQNRKSDANSDEQVNWLLQHIGKDIKNLQVLRSKETNKSNYSNIANRLPSDNIKNDVPRGKAFRRNNYIAYRDTNADAYDSCSINNLLMVKKKNMKLRKKIRDKQVVPFRSCESLKKSKQIGRKFQSGLLLKLSEFKTTSVVREDKQFPDDEITKSRNSDFLEQPEDLASSKMISKKNPPIQYNDAIASTSHITNEDFTSENVFKRKGRSFLSLLRRTEKNEQRSLMNKKPQDKVCNKDIAIGSSPNVLNPSKKKCGRLQKRCQKFDSK